MVINYYSENKLCDVIKHNVALKLFKAFFLQRAKDIISLVFCKASDFKGWFVPYSEF